MRSPAKRRIFRPASVHLGKIESIDLHACKVVVSRSLDGVRSELEYDQAERLQRILESAPSLGAA